MNLTRWQPALMFPRMQRWFEDIIPEWEEEGLSMGAWNPRVDMFLKDNALVVEAELPGMKKEDIDIRVEDHRLTLRGETHEEKKVTEEKYFRHERRTGSFLRSMMLPQDVAVDKVNAVYKDGILRVTFPRTEEALGKKVAIN